VATKRAREADLELNQFLKAWPKMARRTQEAILVLAGVMKARHAERSWDVPPRTKPGEVPNWYLLALNLLKDSDGYCSDREIARRLGISNSTLVRHPGYQHARATYLQKTRRVVKAKRRAR
jgi:hypothetical protein